jgi:hypothetical protein
MSCNNCNLSKCGCQDSYLTTPPPCPTPSTCPDIQPCSEVFPAECVLYTGDDIMCELDVVVAQNTPVSEALNNVVEYFCAGDPPTPSPLKELYYQEEINLLNVATATNWPVGVTNPDNYFHPLGYETLSYTNTSGQSKTYKVHASWEKEFRDFVENNPEIANVVDGAIIKTVATVDSVEYESEDESGLSVFLFDGYTINDTIRINSIPDTVNTTPGDNPVEVRFLLGQLPKNASIFKVVVLNDGETISLKFKSKGEDSKSWLRQAQFMVEEF